MSFGFNVSVGAIDAIQRAFASSANNSANALTENYNPSRAIFQPSESAGVTVDIKQRPKSDEVAAQEAGASKEADQPSETDLAEEAANQIVYSATYKANLNVIKTESQIAGALLDTVG